MSTLLHQAIEWRSLLDARASSTPADTEGDTGLPGPRRTSAIACLLAALVLVVLDAAIANVALPAIAGSLQVTPAESVRVVTAYQMALVMALLPCAALGESRGYRSVYTAGVALFVGASALCALAPSLSFLVAARFIQGLGGAAIMSLGVALMRFVVPQQQLGTAIGWNALAVALASAAGPTVGALILSVASWPWLFAVNLPLGALVLLATRVIPHVPGSARKLDFASVVLNAAAFGALVVGAELMPEHSTPATCLLAAGALSAVALVRRELPEAAPMIPLDLLREGAFRISVIASLLLRRAERSDGVAAVLLAARARSGRAANRPLDHALAVDRRARGANRGATREPCLRAPCCARWVARCLRLGSRRRRCGRCRADPWR